MEQNKVCIEFWKLCRDFKNKTNMNTNYMEYISSLLYLRYYKSEREVFQKIYDQRENYYINIKIDEAISIMRKEIGDEELFSDIQFKNVVFYRSLGEKNVLCAVIDSLYMLCKKYYKSDIVKAYEFAIKQSAICGDIKRNEEIFYTPEEIANVMIKMLIKKDNAKVYDPVCSSGNLLINVAKSMHAQIFGEEENIEYYSIFKTRILLNDIKNENIMCRKKQKIENMKFEYAIFNPPFSQKKWKNDMSNVKIATRYGLSENAVGDYVYVLSTLEKLDKGGKMAIILPHGVLFRENEKRVRERLICENNIEAIIGLPENLFYDTRIPIIILIISKNREKDNVLFIDANSEFKVEKSNNFLAEEHQNKIVDVYLNCKEIEGYSRLVSKEEIKENDYNLSIKKYVRKKKEEKRVQGPQLIKQLKDLEDEKDILEQNIEDILKALNVKDLRQEVKKERKRQNQIYNINEKKIGENIKEARIRKGYTQEMLAERVDLSSKYVSRIELGMSGMRLQLLTKICNVLDVSIEDIIR